MGGRTEGYNVSKEAQSLAAGYAGTMGDLNAAADIGNKRLLFGRRKANDYIEQARENDKLLNQISETNTVKTQSDF
jgi:hypothetical protein